MVTRHSNVSSASPAPASTAAQQRQLDVQRRAELLQATQRRESARAQQMIDEFVVKAKASGPSPVTLDARTVNGRVVKTGVTGWYLRRDHTVAIGTDGGYYILSAVDAPGLPWRPAKVTPTEPPLVVGRGGKDGESGDLKDFLARALSGQVG